MTAPDPKRLRRLVADVVREKNAIARHRDRLRDLVDEINQIGEDCDEAVDSLTTAADALSRLL